MLFKKKKEFEMMIEILRAIDNFMGWCENIGTAKKVPDNFPFVGRVRKLSRGNMDMYSAIENYYDFFERFDGQFKAHPERLEPYFSAILNRIEDYIKNQRINVRKLNYDEIDNIVHWRY